MRILTSGGIAAAATFIAGSTSKDRELMNLAWVAGGVGASTAGGVLAHQAFMDMSGASVMAAWQANAVESASAAALYAFAAPYAGIYQPKMFGQSKAVSAALLAGGSSFASGMFVPPLEAEFEGSSKSFALPSKPAGSRPAAVEMIKPTDFAPEARQPRKNNYRGSRGGRR